MSSNDPGLHGADEVLVLDRPLPVSPGPVSAAAQTAKAHALKILILEDEPTDAELMQRALRKAGLEFTACRVDNRAGFIEALETFAPDIVLSDYRLPDFNGAEALAHVRQIHPEVPVIIVSGILGDEGAVELLHAGAKDYVLKGNLVRLPSAVERAISIEHGVRARKAAERALRESEEKFRTLAEAAHDAILITDGSGTLSYWNPAASRMFGYAAAEMVGRKFHCCLVPERYRAAHEAGLARFAGTGQGPMIGRTIELSARRKDGVEIPVELSLSALLVGEEWRAIGILRDITERKQAEEALRGSQRLIEGILDAIPVRVFWKDKNLVYLGCNAAFARDAGFAEPKDIVGKDDYQMVWRDRAELYRSDDRQVIESGRPKLLIEEPLTTSDGKTLTLLTTKTPLRGPDGELAGVLGTFLDITDRRRAEEDLRSSEERFRLLVENAPDAILLYDADPDRFVAANRTAEQLFACPRDEILKYGPQHFYPPEQPDARPVAQSFAEHNAKALAGEKLTYERRILNGLGQERLCQVTLVQMPSPGRRLLRASFIDITERKAGERALRRLNRTLRTLSRGNEALVRAAGEPDLLSEMCRVIVETGGYRMAWVGVPQQNAAKTVTPVSWAGIGAEFFEGPLLHSWAEQSDGGCVCGLALNSGQAQTSQDLLNDPAMTLWRARFASYGIGATAAFPLRNGTDVFAVLVIYAAEADAFDTDEMNLLQELANDLAFGVRSLREHTAHEALNQRWRTSLEATVGAIANTVEMRDPYTSGHQQRVARLAVAIARQMALPEEEIQGLYLAGIIHDVGKIDIPSDILNKPGKLSKLQYQLIQGHAQAGYDIVKGVDFPWPIAQMVRQHHERLDGSGYPQGLKGEAILHEAKILAVADVVEAMMSHRPYRAALGIDAALAEIEKGRGSIFDPAAVDACIALFRRQGFSFG